MHDEKEFPLLLKSSFTIQRDSNVFFYLHLILDQSDEVAKNEYNIIERVRI